MAYEYDYSALGYSPYGAMAPETFSQVASPYAIPAMGVTSAVPASAVGMAAPSAVNYSPYQSMANDFAAAGYAPSTVPFSPLSVYGGNRVRPTITPDLTLMDFNGQKGYQFVTNKGKAAQTKTGLGGFVPLIEGAQYRLINKQGKDDIAVTGTGLQGLQDVYTMAQQLSAEGDKKAQWEVEMLDPATGVWTQAARDPKGGFGVAGTLMDVGLPIAGSLLLPGLGTGLSAALAGGLGAAAGAATSGVIQGKSLENIALQAALAGGLSYAGGSLFPTGADELSEAAASEVAKGALSEGAKQAAQQVAPQIIGDTMILTGAREAAKAALPAAIGAGVGGLSSAALSELPAIGSKEPNPDQIIVTGQRPLTPFEQAFSDLLPAVTATPTPSPTTPQGAEGDVIEVVAERPPINVVPPPNLEQVLGPLSAVPGGLLGGNILPPETPNPDEIVVTGSRVEPVLSNLAAAGIPATVAGGAALDALTGTQAPTEQPATEKPAGTPSTLEEISTWLDRAGLVSSILGPLAEAIAGGGKGGGGNRNINAAGLGGLSPVFGAQLPAANMPAMQPRTMPQQDWNRYAFGPERSFFTNVPQRLAKGGLAHSDGRSDDVPAMLSRGEYVIDAETMALLGNGDPFAGADKMDEWRVNVRKHKGRQLMKGGISPDAKMPNQYMGGGRV